MFNNGSNSLFNDVPRFINTILPSDTKQYSVSAVDQNELQVKMKFLCLLTLVIHGS